jgi:hypothetical protein
LAHQNKHGIYTPFELRCFTLEVLSFYVLSYYRYLISLFKHFDHIPYPCPCSYVHISMCMSVSVSVSVGVSVCPCLCPWTRTYVFSYYTSCPLGHFVCICFVILHVLSLFLFHYNRTFCLLNVSLLNVCRYTFCHYTFCH